MRNYLIELCCNILNELIDHGGFSEDDQVELITIMNILNKKKEA